jgi:phospholipid N-methyltransferase
MQKVKHTYMKKGDDTIIFRNGDAVMVMQKCPAELESQYKNVIALSPVKNISMAEALKIMAQAVSENRKEKE